MSVPANQRKPPASADALSRHPIRMDLLDNPYGPPESVSAAFAALGQEDPAALLPGVEERLRATSTMGMTPGGILLGAGADALASSLVRSREGVPLVVFPPVGASDAVRAAAKGRDVVEVRRGPFFGVDVDQETASELPPGSVAYLMSPHDPSGAIAQAQDVVRLARTCSLVIVDERHAGFTPRTLAPLAREFDNVAIVRSLEWWAGLSAFPVAWAAGSRKALDSAMVDPPTTGSLIAAVAALDDLRTVEANARRVRDERARLYRMLRKLSIVQPLPSWAGFVLAITELGERDALVAGLEERGIRVHRPDAEGLERAIRVSAGLPAETDALKRALVEITAGM